MTSNFFGPNDLGDCFEKNIALRQKPPIYPPSASLLQKSNSLTIGTHVLKLNNSMAVELQRRQHSEVFVASTRCAGAHLIEAFTLERNVITDC